LRALIASPAHQVTTVRLADRFGDDGLVGGCVVEPGSERFWTVTLLMMSCRAMGRGVIEALLAWLARSAARGGARAVAVPCLVSPRNVPLRLALAASGFRAAEGPRPWGFGMSPGDTVSPRDSTGGGPGPWGSGVSPGDTVSPRDSTG